jgi:hypothetical protein
MIAWSRTRVITRAGSAAMLTTALLCTQLPPVAQAQGKAVLRPEGDALVLELKETGAELALTPWDGEVFTFRVLPRGRFAAMVAGLGERPSGFAQFEVGQDGKLGVLRLTVDDGQRYEFRRE